MWGLFLFELDKSPAFHYDTSQDPKQCLQGLSRKSCTQKFM